MKGFMRLLGNGKLRATLKRWGLSNPWSLVPNALKVRMLARTSFYDEQWVAEACGRKLDRIEWARALFADELSVVSPLVSIDWYRSRYGVNASAGDALLHYIYVGDRLGLRCHPWFDAGTARRSLGAAGTWLHAMLPRYMSNWAAFDSPHPLFDQKFYLEEYLDVKQSGINPLVHFVLHGLVEGRRPNALFDPSWYKKANPDVAASGMLPALHFALYGAYEGRNPGPDFDVGSYRAQVGNAALDGLDALSHYLTIGRAEGIVPVARDIPVSCLVEEYEIGQRDCEGALVDVVIPVYRGLEETRACIESVLSSRSINVTRLHIYNDCSPEPEITEYLRGLAQQNAHVRYVENEVNLGFVGTVNRAMRAARDLPDFKGVILLNSDAEVSGDWVERMQAHAVLNMQVATVTAMSNNATICSYPHFGDNPTSEDETVCDIDALAAIVNCGKSVDLPTGVGFCMLITKRALDKLGLFDEEAFGKGYGEEVDFCQRALLGGMRNLLALDVYVKHAGEVSFASSSKPGKIAAEKIIVGRYPNYPEDVSAFIARDPGLYGRLRLTFARWRASGRKVHVFFTHALGGGTERRVRELVESIPGASRAVVVRPSKGSAKRLSLDCSHPDESFFLDVEVEDGAQLAALLQVMGASKIEVHHALGFDDFLREGLAACGVPFDFFVHDYYAVCPQITLTDENGSYCGERGMLACDGCIGKRQSHGAKDIRNWRTSNEWLVLGAKDLAAPSLDCSQRIGRYLGRFPDVRPHEPAEQEIVSQVYRRSDKGGRAQILVLGALAPHKGKWRVYEVVRDIIRRSMALRIHLIGDPLGDVPKSLWPAFSWSGAYSENELMDQISDAGADAFLFMSQAPETYSYTLTAAMKTGLPIVATDLGAFVERLEGYQAAYIVKHDIPANELADVLQRAVRERRVA